MRLPSILFFFMGGFPLLLSAQDEDYTLTLSDAECDADDEVEIVMTLDFADGDPIQAYQWGVCHADDILTLEDEDDVELGSALTGMSYTFEALFTFDEPGASGWAAAGLFNVLTAATLEPEDDLEVYVVTYTCSDPDAESTTVEFCDTLGDPLINVGVVVGNTEVEPVQIDGEVTIATPPHFLRGDADGNGTVSGLLDGLYILRWAFERGPAPGCEDAADVNDNGTVQAIVDSIALLRWGFQGADEPPSPGPSDCGADPGEDDGLGCETVSDSCD